MTYSPQAGFSPEETPQEDARAAPARHVPDSTAFPETITTVSAVAAIPASNGHSPGHPSGAVINLDSGFSAFGGGSDVTHSSSTPVPQHEGDQGGDSSTVTSTGSYWRSSLYRPSTSWPLGTEEEARLFHHFVRNLGAWVSFLPFERIPQSTDATYQVDCCEQFYVGASLFTKLIYLAGDEKFHFATEVPQRALNYPVIANAILALASRHLARVSGAEDFKSAEYMSECLQMMIPVLDDPLGALDENLLAAIVILRLYEEMDGKCNRSLHGCLHD